MTTLCRHDIAADSCGLCLDLEEPFNTLQLLKVIEERTTTCREKTCGAEIVWAKTINDRNMPIDAEPSHTGGDIELYLEDDELRCRVIRNSSPGDLFHTSHFATCAKAESFRGGRS